MKIDKDAKGRFVTRVGSDEPSDYCIDQKTLSRFAEMGNYTELPFFMGRAHLFHVKAFLIDTNGYAKSTSAYKRGQERGSQLAENLADAQRSENAEELLNAISTWDPQSEESLAWDLVGCTGAKEPSEY